MTKDAHRLRRLFLVGTVVELFAGAFEIEFSDDEGRTHAQVTFPLTNRHVSKWASGGLRLRQRRSTPMPQRSLRGGRRRLRRRRRRTRFRGLTRPKRVGLRGDDSTEAVGCRRPLDDVHREGQVGGVERVAEFGERVQASGSSPMITRSRSENGFARPVTRVPITRTSRSGEVASQHTQDGLDGSGAASTLPRLRASRRARRPRRRSQTRQFSRDPLSLRPMVRWLVMFLLRDTRETGTRPAPVRPRLRRGRPA